MAELVDTQLPSAPSDAVTEAEIRRLVRYNWVFYLYDHRRWRWFALFVLPPLLVVIGAVISGVLGEFDTFIRNPLAYTGALGLLTALCAYLWLAHTLPRVLVDLYPAFDGDPVRHKENYLNIIKKRAALVNNVPFLMVVGGVIGLLFLIILINQYNSAGQGDWLGASWVESDHRLFFALYQGVFSVIGSGFLLGTGLIGLIGTIWLIQGIFILPVRLEYYRRIGAVSDVSIGITFWTLLAFIAVILSVSISPNAAQDIGARVLLSVLASGALVSIISLPILFAHDAIIREKKMRIGYYEEYCHTLSTKIQDAAANKPEEVEDLRKSRAQLISEMEEIEKIPEWPVSILRAVQLIGVSPLIGLLNFAVPLIVPGISGIWKQIIDIIS
ncbi:MAG: hypothetical protein KF716_07645 [Anaerolineae bacterium]|nr:hypothetical protein [Anaerolineae bacterium]